MKYARSQKSDILLPSVGLGTMGFGGYFKADTSNWNRCVNVIEEAHEHGVRAVDTAEIYGEGNAEKILGAVTASKKNDLFIMSKFSPHRRTKKDIRKALENTLERLGRDWVDVYQPHWPDPKQDVRETLECLTEFQKEGKIKFIGVSNFNLNSLPELPTNTYELPRFYQCEFNPMEQAGFENLVQLANKQDGILVGYSPFREGQLFEHANFKKLQNHAHELRLTAGQLILAWIISHHRVVTIPKSSNLKRLNENFLAMEVHLSDESIDYISDLFRVKILDILPSIIIPFDEKVKADRSVYLTLEEALRNEHFLSPSPKEIAEEIEQNKGILNKPIKVKENVDGSLTLIEGRLRYWGWIIAYGYSKPIKAIIVNGAG